MTDAEVWPGDPQVTLGPDGLVLVLSASTCPDLVDQEVDQYPDHAAVPGAGRGDGVGVLRSDRG